MYLVLSLSRDILSQDVTSKTAWEVWEQIEATFTYQTRARLVNTGMALATMQKANLTITEYVTKIKMLGDEMAYADKPLGEEEIVSYIMAGLDFEYNPVVSSVVAQREPVTVNELHAQLLSFEMQLALQGSNNSAYFLVNVATRGGSRRGHALNRGGGNGCGGRSGGDGCNNNSSGSCNDKGGNTTPQHVRSAASGSHCQTLLVPLR